MPGDAVAPGDALREVASGGPRRAVLVTGGAGFIGASLIRALEARGEAVRVLDDGRAAGLGSVAATGAEVVAADLMTADLDAALRGIGAVVHLAAQTSVPASVERPIDDMRQNVEGTLRILEAARRSGVRRVLFASSAAAAGTVAPPVREDAVPAPAVPYGAAKLAGEAYLRAYHSLHGMITTSLRFANAYGPFSRHKSSAVAAFVRRGLAGEPLLIYGDGSQTRDFVHVDDIVRLVLLVLDADEAAVGGRVFNGGSGRETSVSDVARTVVDLTGTAVGIEHRSARPGDVRRSALDITLARDVLGYRPSVRLEDGLASTVGWFREASRA